MRRVPYVGWGFAVLILVLFAFGFGRSASTAGVTLSTATAFPRPYTLLTYILAHADLWHVAVNAAVIAVAGPLVERAGHVRAAAVMVLAAVTAGLVFCGVSALVRPGLTLEGASSVALALAAYAATAARVRWLTIALGILAVLGLLGPNVGGGAAHIAGYAVGVLCAAAHMRQTAAGDERRHRELHRIHTKIQQSGYASLTDMEKSFLNNQVLDDK